MKVVKIFGAGSIGNHLAHASRSLGYEVVMCDVDQAALDRTKNEIYPKRYGVWDHDILLCKPENAPKQEYDLMIVGTPPDTHMEIALSALAEKPKAILIEKPLCGPDIKSLGRLYELATEQSTKLFVGYDHVVGWGAAEFCKQYLANEFGRSLTLDVEFREHWGGIFSAHPWLSGPWETYLGFSHKGGGALGEHSHALNLWQFFARKLSHGRIIEVQAKLDMVIDDKVEYDSMSFLNLTTETGFTGRCVQDVVTMPSRKCASIQGEQGTIALKLSPQKDLITLSKNGAPDETLSFEKTRPDDFIRELLHINECIFSDRIDSPISYEYGAETMLVIAAAHMSNKFGRTVYIDYSKGYHKEALSFDK